MARLRTRQRLTRGSLGPLAAVACAVAISACGSSSNASNSASSNGSSSASSNGSSTSSAAASTGTSSGFELRIGDLMPFTGTLSPYGPSLAAATKLAANYINKQLAADGLSSRYSVKIVENQDSQSKATPSVEGATKLAEVDKVDMIDGPLNSGALIAVAHSVTLPKEILLDSPTASSTAITELKGHLVFQIAVTNAFNARELVVAAEKKLGKGATVNVGWSNDASDTEIAKLFISLWKKAGGNVGKTVSWNEEGSNFETEAQELVEGHPAGWVILAFPLTFEKLGPALVRTGQWSPAKSFMNPAMRDPEVLAKLPHAVSVGLLGVSPAIGETSLQKNFTTLFKKEEPGKTVTGYETFAFDSVVAPFLAALQAGSAEPHAIASHMQSVTNPPGKEYTYEDLGEAIKAVTEGKPIDYNGVSGPIAIGANDAASQGAFDIWQYLPNGKLVTLKTYSGLPG